MGESGTDQPEVDFARRRDRMVDVQLLGRDVRNPRVLQAMRTVPRHEFVPPAEIPHAYEDSPLPIGHGQTISQPYIVASMTEYLRLKPTDRVLEIGTGCGYQTAVLAELVAEVATIEIVSELLETAKRALISLKYGNIHFKLGDGSLGWPEKAPFDAIILTAAAPRLPSPLIEQMAVGGRMVAPICAGSSDLQELVLVTKTPRELIRQSLYQVRFVPMRGAIEF